MNANGIIGGWATTGQSVTTFPGELLPYTFGTDWATVAPNGQIVPLASYTADAWASGNNTTVTQNSVQPVGSTTNSLRFVTPLGNDGSAVVQTVTLSGANLIASGGILVTCGVSAAINPTYFTEGYNFGTINARFAIAGGTLTSRNGTDLIVNQFNTLLSSTLTISSAITDNGPTSIGLTLGGNTVLITPADQGGVLVLTNPANSYSGPTVINADTTLRAGAANVIPAKSAAIISMLGTLDLNGFNQSVGSLANFNGSLAALSGLNFGYGTTVAANGVATLTVGGDNTSTTFNGALLDATSSNSSGMLSLVKVGSGTLTLGNSTDNITSGMANLSVYTGATRISGGTLQTAAVDTLPFTTAVSVAAGASLVLGGFGQQIGSLTGGGSVTNNGSLNARLVVGNNNASPGAFPGVLSDTTSGGTGTLSIAKVGLGTLTLTTPVGQSISGSGGYDTYSGPTILAGGTLMLDFSGAAAGSVNLLNAASILTLAGGTLAIDEHAGAAATTQNFSAGTIIDFGASAIAVKSNGNTSPSSGLALGFIARSAGGTVDFATLPVTGGVTTTTANSAGSILGGWATVAGGTSWAVSGGNGIAAGNITALTTFKADNFTNASNNVTVTANDAPAASFTINSLRFNANSGSAGFTLTLPNDGSTIASGGILVTPGVGPFTTIITGGPLASGNGNDLIINQYNSAGGSDDRRGSRRRPGRTEVADEVRSRHVDPVAIGFTGQRPT